jgi:hypothetical protein
MRFFGSRQLPPITLRDACQPPCRRCLGVRAGTFSPLREQQRSILAEWETGARKLPRAADLPRPVLIDYIPPLLEQISELVDQFKEGHLAELPRSCARASPDSFSEASEARWRSTSGDIPHD